MPWKKSAATSSQDQHQIRAEDLATGTISEPINAGQASPQTKAAPTEQNTNSKDSMASVFLNLYLDEAAATEDPLGCITLAGLETKEELFEEVEVILEGELGANDTISMIRVRRADGQVFPGPNILSLAITRGGKQDMWSILVQMVRDPGTGDGCLRGYVKVRKGAGDK